MNGDISGILRKYGTSLSETRKLIKELKGVSYPQVATPKFLTSDEAREYIPDIPDDWMVKIYPTKEGEALNYSFISPDQTEVKSNELMIRQDTGEWLTPKQVEAIEGERKEREAIYGELFPSYKEDLDQLFAWANESDENLYQFYNTIAQAGRTPDTEKILRALNATEQQIEKFYETKPRGGAVTLEGDYIPESAIKDTWDAFLLAGAEIFHRTKQYFLSVIPGKLFPEPIPPTAEEAAKYPQFLEAHERVVRFNEEMRDRFRKICAERQTKHEEWITKHPELQPKPEYEKPKNIGDYIHLIKSDPAFAAYIIADSLPFSIGILGTTMGVSYATKNPYLGLAAGTAIATPLQSQDLYLDLLEAGCPESRAAELAVPVGALIASIESVANLPLLRAVSGPFAHMFKTFERGMAKAVIKATIGHMIKKGIKTFTLIEFTEALEEVAQGAIQNYTVSFFDTNRTIFENVDETIIRTLIATSPFAIFGGGMSMRHVSPDVAQAISDSQKETEGWQQDKLTGEWYRPEKIVDYMNEDIRKFMDGGLTDEEARLKALNEAARTPEGEKAISDAAKKLVPKADLPSLINNLETQLKRAGQDISYLQVEAARVGLDSTQYYQRLKEIAIKAGIPEVEVKAGVDREIEEAVAQIEGLKAWLESEPAAKLTNLIKKTGWYKGEVSNLTVKQYRDLTGKREIKPNILTEDKKHVRWEYALDEIATEYGYESAEEFREAIEKTAEGKARIKELEAEVRTYYTEKPLEALPEPTPKQIEDNLGAPGGLELTLEQTKRALDVFGKYLDEPSTVNAWELTRELRRETRAKRAEDLKARAQELIVEKGINIEEAIDQAIKETMSGELPVARTDYFYDITQKMRDVLFNKVYQALKDEPFELMSTTEALTNALRGKSIPREPGVRGGSAYSRLQRVFGDQPQVFKAIDKAAKEGKKLEDVIEGIYHEIGRPPIPIDQASLDYFRSLRDYGAATLPFFEQPADLHVSDLRTPAELNFAWRKLAITRAYLEGRYDKIRYDIELAEARDKAFPPPPVTHFDAPIEKAFKQGEMWTFGEKQMLVRVLKEIAWSPVDIGNFMRANKASFDMSYLRQSKVLSSGHPLVGFQAHTAAWQSLFSQKHAEAEWQRITRDPRFEMYERLRIDRDADPLRVPAFADQKGTAQWRRAEEYGFPTVERLIPRLTMKIPWIKVSERAFTAGTNKIVWRLWNLKYDSLMREAEKVASGEVKLPEGEAVDIVKEMGDFQVFLGDAIQRASLGRAKTLAPAFGAIFFAARSKLGRFFFPKHLLGITVRNGKVGFNPHIMKEAWRDFAMMNLFWGGLILLGDWLDLWDAEKDPRSGEFMSARIGNLRIDPWAGYRQFAVLYARLVTGIGISSVTGAEYEANKLGALQSFVRNSLAPMPSLLLDFWTGRNFLGAAVEVTNKREWLDRILPFSIQDVWEAFEEGTKEGVISILPAIYGEGVQTYTGDWEENFGKLGLPKYLENTAYGLDQPIYDAQDLWSDTASQFKGVDPETLTERKGYPPYIKAMAEAYNLIKLELDSLPSEKLININADPDKGTTFEQYYLMWRDRKKLVAGGDDAEWTIQELQPDGKYKAVTYKGKEALEAFDRDERTRNANIGNFGQREYSLLVKYHSLTDKRKQDEWLKGLDEESRKLLTTNPRQDWLKSHPKENASLSVWGQSKIYTIEAYNETQKLMREFDIPDNAAPEHILPPEDIRDNYFKYQDAGEKYGYNSAEAKLIIAEDNKLRKWLDREPIETLVESLKISVKWRDMDKQYESYSDRDSPNYIATEEDRRETREKLLTENPDYRKDVWRRDAYNDKAPEGIIDDYVELQELNFKYSPNSAESRLYKLEHSELFEWGKKEKNWLDIEDNPKALRISVKWRDLDDQYASYADRTSPNYIATDEGREAAREKLLQSNSEYAKDRRRRDAYGIKDFPESQIETYVEWYTGNAPDGKFRKPENWKATMRTDEWYEDDWYLQEHPEFVDAMVKAGIRSEKPDFSKVPTRAVFQKYLTYVRLPEGAARIQYRQQNLDLDAWLLLTKKVSKPATETGKKRLTGEEKAIQKAEEEAKAYTLKEWIERQLNK